MPTVCATVPVKAVGIRASSCAVKSVHVGTPVRGSVRQFLFDAGQLGLELLIDGAEAGLHAAAAPRSSPRRQSSRRPPARTSPAPASARAPPGPGGPRDGGGCGSASCRRPAPGPRGPASAGISGCRVSSPRISRLAIAAATWTPLDSQWVSQACLAWWMSATACRRAGSTVARCLATTWSTACSAALASFDLGAAADLGGLLLGLGDDLDRLGPHVVEVVLRLGGHVVEVEGDAGGAQFPIGGADHGGHVDFPLTW